MGWLRKKAKQIGKGIKKIGSKIAGAVRKVTRSKAFKIVAAIALATIVGPAAWATWGAGGSGTFMANLSAQTAAVTGGAFGTAAATAGTGTPAVVAGNTVAAGTATQQLATTVPAALGIPATTTAATGTAASNAAIAAGTDALTVSLATTPVTVAQAANAANVAAATSPNVFTRVGQGIQNFADKNKFVAGVAGSVVGGVALGAINAKLADDPELQGVQVGESAQERSALAELYSGYQAKYGNNASKEYMLGMNFGYDSVGYQTTA
jgi:hypothetical protein